MRLSKSHPFLRHPPPSSKVFRAKTTPGLSFDFFVPHLFDIAPLYIRRRFFIHPSLKPAESASAQPHLLLHLLFASFSVKGQPQAGNQLETPSPHGPGGTWNTDREGQTSASSNHLSVFLPFPFNFFSSQLPSCSSQLHLHLDALRLSFPAIHPSPPTPTPPPHFPAIRSPLTSSSRTLFAPRRLHLTPHHFILDRLYPLL